MKYLNKFLCFALVVTTFFSCDDYLDVNTDPDNPSLEDVSPDFMLAASQSVPAATFGVTMNQLGNTLGGAWGGNVIQFAGPFDDEFRYNVTSTFYSGIFDNLMVRTANYTNIINYENEEVNYSNHKAIAKLLRAFYFQYLVDIYGDLPYFDKHQFTNGLQVAYNDDAVIYQDLLKEVNEAIALIDNAASDVLSVGTEDIIYQGNMSNWKKFGNTLKLKLIVRQSNVISDADAQAALSGLTTSDFIGFGDAATLNPGYVNENNRQNPVYASWGFDTSDLVRGANDLIVASEFSIQMMDGTLSPTFDNRLTRLYRVNNQGNYLGIKQGQLLADLPNGLSVTLSKLGPGLGLDMPSAANASMDLNIFTETESFFLQSEAVARNYMTGNGKSLFDNGVTASFNLLGANNSGGYIANINGNVGFDFTGTTEQKVQGIITQKWLALSGINGAEAWIEMTRTGYPNAPLTETQISGVRPVKLLYPLSELSGNSANVPNQNTSDAFVKSIFWN